MAVKSADAILAARSIKIATLLTVKQRSWNIPIKLNSFRQVHLSTKHHRPAM
jgi:hypothetical protein